MKTRHSNAGIAAAALGTIALYGYYTYMGLRTPLPGQDQEVSQGLTVEKHEFETADGVTLRLKRYANPGGTPVLLCHGFGGTGFSFDLPREGHNMAVHLARQGFDVWVSSWRGCGREPYLSDCDGWKHTIDDLAIYDAPALVDGVTRVTGKRPFWIGHSMGGHILYMFLQGIRYEDGRVVSDPELVRERHEKLTGGITIGSPPGFAYSKGDPYYMVFKSRAGTAVLNALKQEMLRRELTSPCVPRLGGNKGTLDNHPRVVMALSRNPLVTFTYCRSNTDKDTTTSLAKWGTGDTSAGMYVQLFGAILDEHFLEHPGRCAPGSQYDYTANMGKVTLPLFFLTGTHDFANPVTIRRLAFEQVSSDTKEYLCLPGYGHTDLLMGLNAEQDVYGPMCDWMRSIAGEQAGDRNEG
ncbi:MAG: alpha/beta fold hydrolase [Candidatus Geothermincolia bacterium]